MRVALPLHGSPSAPARGTRALAAVRAGALAAAVVGTLTATRASSLAAQAPAARPPAADRAGDAPRLAIRTALGTALGRGSAAAPETVTVAGRASVGSGVLQARVLDVAIDDGTAGVRVFDRGMQRVRPGDSVEATGVIQRYRGSAELFATRVRVVPGARRAVEPVELPSPRLDDEMEGRLVRVRARVVDSGWSEGGRWFALAPADDDGAPPARAAHVLTLWVPASHVERPRLDGFLPGDQVDVTGIVAVFRDNPTDPQVWQLIPRGAADVRVLGVPRKWMRLGGAIVAAALAIGALVLVLARLLSRRSVRALQETQARYEQLLALSPAAVLVHADGHVLFANAAAARLLGAPDARALAGRAIADFADAEFPDALGGAAAPIDAPAETRRARVRTLQGSPIDVEITRSPCRYHDRAAAVAILRDVTEELRREEELRALAYVDELTGLLNRRGFAVLAEAAMRRARAAGRGATLLFADLDNLKRINDVHGHAAGDDAIRTIARALAHTVRRSDVVARWSGDELVALLVDAEQTPPGGDDAELTTRFQQALARETATLVAPFPITASLGAARLDTDEATPVSEALAEAFSRADARLYREKAGRGAGV